MVLTFFCACISVVSSLLLLFLFFFFCTIYILSLSFLPACFERYPEKAVFIVLFSPFPFFFSLFLFTLELFLFSIVLLVVLTLESTLL